ncbi:MAG TPA: ArsO family NAD(P)H-dependent flavin-containing monooxygenase [Nocardioidaceae bacterium]|nr:ArsO family NAD(P)H-dependent flavin-containing monooxygenase [Nocardioidaceae bacterium]
MPDLSREQHPVDVAVVGGGQSGLAAGFYLRRAGLEPGTGYVILDAAEQPGGAWPLMWPSLRTFSPTQYSSLPGWMMPPWTGDDGYPPASHVAAYLRDYERRYDLPVLRPTRVRDVRRARERLRVETDRGDWSARHVISATGTWSRPFVPRYPGVGSFRGKQLHAAQYRCADEVAGKRVVVVGGGNSAAQILAEVSTVADTVWVAQRPPRFLPDDVDGHALFMIATARRRQIDSGKADGEGVAGLGDIVMVPSVRDARDRGVLRAEPMFTRLTPSGVAWPDREVEADVVLWCTGFRAALSHLAPLGLRDREGRIATDGTRALREPRLHLLGYGDWTGSASATLIGVGRTAKEAVAEIVAEL